MENELPELTNQQRAELEIPLMRDPLTETMKQKPDDMLARLAEFDCRKPEAVQLTGPLPKIVFEPTREQLMNRVATLMTRLGMADKVIDAVRPRQTDASWTKCKVCGIQAAHKDECPVGRYDYQWGAR